MNSKELEKISNKARHLMVDSLICAGCGHPGGAFSSVDVMTTLYFEIMNIDAKEHRLGLRIPGVKNAGEDPVQAATEEESVEEPAA